MIKMIKEDRSDMTLEGYVQFAIMLEMIWASEVICERAATAIEHSGLEKTLFHQKRKALNDLKSHVKAIVRDLDIAFDGTFSQVYHLKGRKVIDQVNAIQASSNDMIKLLLIYYSRADGDDVKKDSMKKALMNFKPSQNIDLDGLLEYYSVKIG